MSILIEPISLDPTAVSNLISAASGLKYIGVDVAVSATTSLQVSGLSDGKYRVLCSVKAAVATNTIHVVCVNGTTTGFNRGFVGSTNSGHDTGSPRLNTAAIGGRGFLTADIIVNNGVTMFNVITNQVDVSTNKLIVFAAQQSQSTISSIDIIANVADCIDIGSYLEVWEYVS